MFLEAIQVVKGKPKKFGRFGDAGVCHKRISNPGLGSRSHHRNRLHLKIHVELRQEKLTAYNMRPDRTHQSKNHSYES
jgi:hypothetical protein